MASPGKFRLDVTIADPTILAAAELDSEIYADIVAGFQEQLEIQGVAIVFSSIEKECLAQRLDEKLDWQTVGFLPDTTVRVEMLDTDFAEFAAAGIDEAQATVLLQELTFQVTEIQQVSTHPIVTMILNKSK